MKDIYNYIDENIEEYISDLQELIRKPSVSAQNIGLKECAEYVKEQTGCFVHYEEIGTDADQRDYEVSYNKLESEGFSCDVDMKTGIQELIKVTPILQIRHQYS